MSINLYFLSLAVISLLQLASSFTITNPSSIRLSTTSLPAFYNDFEGFGDDTSNNSYDLYADLRDRQNALAEVKKQSLEIWREAPTELQGWPIGDWVRRVAVDTSSSTTQNVVAGGAGGSLYIFSLATGTLGELPEVHEGRREDDDPELLNYLYGEYDGGGIVGLARKDKLVASSGREGGVHLSLINSKAETELMSLGKIEGQESTATSLLFDQSDTLWVGSYEDSTIRAYNTEEMKDKKTTIQMPLVHEIEAKSGILSLAIADEIGLGVAATAKDGIVLFSLTEGTVLATWNPFASSTWNPFAASSDEFARSVALVQNDEATRTNNKEVGATWSIVVGGSNGNLHQRQLNLQEGTIDSKMPWNDKLGPPHAVPDRYCHKEAIMSLASPGPGLLLSAGQDGTIRGWDCSYLQKDKVDQLSGKFEEDMWIGGFFGSGSKPSQMYGMSGYKVWLGSLVILNGNLLVTDGADNVVIAHHFGEDAEEK